MQRQRLAGWAFAAHVGLQSSKRLTGGGVRRRLGARGAGGYARERLTASKKAARCSAAGDPSSCNVALAAPKRPGVASHKLGLRRIQMDVPALALTDQEGAA